MGIEACIDNAAQRVRESKLTDENKARALRLLEVIRGAPRNIQRFLQGVLASIRDHREAAEILGFALLLAILAKAVPVLGDVLAFLVILVGAGAAFICELRRTFACLFQPIA